MLKYSIFRYLLFIYRYAIIYTSNGNSLRPIQTLNPVLFLLMKTKKMFILVVVLFTATMFTSCGGVQFVPNQPMVGGPQFGHPQFGHSQFGGGPQFGSPQFGSPPPFYGQGPAQQFGPNRINFDQWRQQQSGSVYGPNRLTFDQWRGGQGGPFNNSPRMY